MIIRPVVSREYTALPNAIFKDRRLSADTRAMVALVLSKPKTWQLRPPALARELSREGGKRVGRAKLKRMFDEAIVAGYMARSVAQTHTDGGLWGPYVYFMGMPEDVAAAVKREGVVVLPHAEKPHTVEPHAANQQAYKRKNLETRDFIKPLPNLPQFAGSNGQAIKSPRSIEGPEVIQHRLARRLGDGNVERGFLILGELPDCRRDELTAMERVGELTDAEVASVREGGWR